MNAHGRSSTSTVFLFVVAILDAGRNALSFFLLLVVSLGLSVVRESLGRNMIRCQILAGLHFIFGGEYFDTVETKAEMFSSALRCRDCGAGAGKHIRNYLAPLHYVSSIWRQPNWDVV